jgi:hypothetical protein
MDEEGVCAPPNSTQFHPIPPISTHFHSFPLNSTLQHLAPKHFRLTHFLHFLHFLRIITNYSPYTTELLKRDPQFAVFHDDVASILQAFDRVKEWADLIRCLQRLGNSLSKFSKFSVVPQKIVLAKRLCQCLNPVLPSGVHLKALAVYELILSKIGDSIVQDAPLYCAGLFPLLQHASIQVRVSDNSI